MEVSTATESRSIKLMMVLHRKIEDEIWVSDTGDRKDMVALPQAQVKVMMAARPGFVVITMPERLARDKGLV